jgi:hypothetical protein
MGLLETFNRAVEKQRGSYKNNTSSDIAYKRVVLSERQAHKLVKKYPNDVELWNRFWQHMSDECDRGAPFEYVLACSEVLEKVWEANGGFKT